MWSSLVVYLIVFFAAVGEELGWQGHMVPALRDRLPALAAALLVGVVWACRHIVSYLQTHRSPGWIAWQCLQTVLCRVLIVWLCANGRCLLPAAHFHAMLNVAELSCPDHGSHYDPRATAFILAVAVVARWGALTLTRPAVATSMHRLAP